MQILSFITIIFKVFVLSILINNPDIRLFIGCIILIGVFYTYYKYESNSININELKITKPVPIILVFILVLTSLISSLLFFRLNNLGKSLDLPNIYDSLYIYVINTDKYVIVANIVYFISLLLILLRIIFFIHNFIFKQFNKIHIYLRNNKFYMNNIIRKFFYPYYRGPIEKLKLLILKGIYTKFILTGDYNSMEYGMFAKRFNYLDFYILFLQSHLSLFIFSISVIYDLIFNNLILTKIYYIFPLVFLYLTWQTIVKFYTQRDLHLDSCLGVLLYENPIIVAKGKNTQSKLNIDLEELALLNQYLLNNFKYIIPKDDA